MATPISGHCDQLRAWLQAYPATEAEDAALLACEQADKPTPELVQSVLETHPLDMPSARRVARLVAVEPTAWPKTLQRLVESLAAKDDAVALVNLTASGGVEGLGVSGASLILSAFRPNRFVPFLVPSRRALEEIGLLPARKNKLLESNQWSGHLAACRELSAGCGLTLREVGRALAAGGYRSTHSKQRVG